MKKPLGTPLLDKITLTQTREMGLRYSTDTEAGFFRYRRGKQFCYRDKQGKALKDAPTLERIKRLAIPPAYTEVWICASERGHLQATGRDARGRKQYRYHARWRTVRDRDKFARIVEFAQRLPTLRRQLRKDLASHGLGRNKVLAIVVSVMAQTLIQIGNAEYQASNHSYGLTTLRNRHVSFAKGRVLFQFRGKSGLHHEVALDDKRLVRLLRRCRELPGQSLFQYLDDDGVRQPVDSGMVNDYLHEVMGEEFTAKDFRTWGGTCAAIAVLVKTPLPEKISEQPSVLAHAIKTVAAQLGNTPAVCRSSYIHPLVFESWTEGSLHKLLGVALPDDERKQELAALRFLRKRLRHTRVRSR